MPISNHGYNADTREYTVQFRDGGPIYKYQQVDPETAGIIQSADDDKLGAVIRDQLVSDKSIEFIKIMPEEQVDQEAGGE